MNLQTIEPIEVCPRTEIAAYLDGELAPADEFRLDHHFANCKKCLDELNAQKKMLSALDFAFDNDEEIKLPKNFAKVVATTAESEVRGLRSKKERFRALYLCSALFLIVIIGLGAETEKVFFAFGKFGEQIWTIAEFVFHLIYNLTIGLSVVARSLSQQIVFNSNLPVFIIAAGLMFSIFTLSRFCLRYNRR